MKARLSVLYQAVLVSCLIFIIAGCDKPVQEPLRLGSSPWPGYEPLYLARDLGYLDENKVNLFELPSSDITMESFRNRSTDVATLTLDETYDLLDDGIALRILLVMDISHGGDAVLASPDIKKLSDLKGKRLSVVNIPLGMYMLTRLLDKAGLERKDVQVFPMAETKQLKFYKSGKADAVITFEPVKTRLEELGAKVIFDSSMIPDEIFDLLVVHEDIYMQRNQDLCDISRQWFRTINYMKENRSDAAKRITKRLGLKVKDYDALLAGIIIPDEKGNKALLGGNTPGIIKPAEKLNEIMLTEKLVVNKKDINKAIAPEFARCY